MLFKNLKVKYCESMSAKDLTDKWLYRVWDADIVIYDPERQFATITYMRDGVKKTKGMLPFWEESMDRQPDEYWTFEEDSGGRFDAIREKLKPVPKEYPYLEKKLLAGFDAESGGYISFHSSPTATIEIPRGARVLILVDNS